MAALAVSPRRVARTPARGSRPPRALTTGDIATEPPHKKRKYIPGGPGGGGRYRDDDGTEILVGGTGPGGYAVTAPRARDRGMTSEKRDAEEDATPLVTRSAMQTRPRRERTERYRPGVASPRPRYTNAAAAAAASQASDGYKPREERSWEDFHPDLDIDGALPIFTADEVDGRTSRPEQKLGAAQRAGSSGDEVKPLLKGDVDPKDAPAIDEEPSHAVTKPAKRPPGRPPRNHQTMLNGLGPPSPKRIEPLPIWSKGERLNLHKASFRIFSHFLKFEQDQKENKVNYVDRTMSHVGFQETDRYELPPGTLVRLSESQQIEDEAEVSLRLESDGPAEVLQSTPAVGRVEYDMDEQDEEWLEVLNAQRKSEGVDAIKPAIFEITMTQIEKEYHALEKRIPKPQPRHAQTHRPRSSSQAAVAGDPNPPGDEPDSKCSICDDGDCENANAIIFCDGCDLAVHQECYGVPFIPEGQWFCRKCKEIGRGTPTCIFCPNVDGAFKQTNTLRWSHLLCAIWIPEVSIANMTFMEPITDVDKVPKSRWKLNCYICNQKMGACIQCGNKNCYQAFHVSCARKAKLFLKMKSAHQQGIDTTALKAFCDKHVPPEWRRTHDTDRATLEAKHWYRKNMKDRRWADSQSVALEMGAPPAPDGGLRGDSSEMADTIAVAAQKRKRNQPAKLSWRLPSGAPVVPAVVFNTVDTSLTRFTIRKRKEFVEKACRYWTLKREARRGAALLKRLQLQLESFSSMEITRRHFAGVGAAGRPRLLRRIEFAEMLQKDMRYLVKMTGLARRREELRWQEVQTLRLLLDTVYFPITPLLQPILLRAQKLDEKTRVFNPGLDILAHRLRERYYTSVSDFSRDLSAVFSSRLAESENLNSTSTGPDAAEADLEAIHTQLNEVQPGTAEHMQLTQEQKDLKRLAKRIVKAVKELIEEALRREAQLRGMEVHEQLRQLDSMGLFASTAGEGEVEEGGKVAGGKRRSGSGSDVSAVAGASPTSGDHGDVDMTDTDELTGPVAEVYLGLAANGTSERELIPNGGNNKPLPASRRASRASSTHAPAKPILTDNQNPTTEPLSPPISTFSAPAPPSAAGTDPHDTFRHGGVPWYLEPFDPIGTTVHDERWTGPAVLRGMSEELSDMDEDTLTELGGSAVEGTPVGGAAVVAAAAGGVGPAKPKRLVKKKGRRMQWSRARR